MNMYLFEKSYTSFFFYMLRGQMSQSGEHHDPSYSSRPGPMPRSFPRKRTVVATVDGNQEARSPRTKKPSFRQNKYKSDNRQGKKPSLILPPFPCGIKKATSLLD